MYEYFSGNTRNANIHVRISREIDDSDIQNFVFLEKYDGRMRISREIMTFYNGWGRASREILKLQIRMFVFLEKYDILRSSV